MNSNNDSDDELNVSSVMERKTKKRKSYGRMSTVNKRIRLQSHEMGPDCKCLKKCFEKVPLNSRNNILQHFNLLNTIDAQNSYLSGLISVLPVQRKTKKEGARHYEASYKYRVRVIVENITKEIDVCRKAFMAIHGITRKKVEYLVASLKNTGYAPEDKRGKHKNHANKLPVETVSLVRQHINSFKGRESHYSLRDSAKIYLSEELNIFKMHTMFLELYPNQKVSYETYRKIFNRDFNISFGYPRTDTCSTCDEFQVKRKTLELEKQSKKRDEEKSQIDKEIGTLTTENMLHRKKAEMFYTRKRIAKSDSKKSSNTAAICMDFAKNLPVPNIATNDTYYKRQLSVYAFNIHLLPTSASYFFVYPETQGKKGSDDVCSLLHHFVYNFLSPEVKHLRIFCDSCSGQQKNFTFFRFLHNLVNAERRLETITITFPVRGHSYMECDKNFGLVNQKSRAEVPKDWLKVFKEARHNPSPFTVIDVDHSLFRSWTNFLNDHYAKKSPFPSRPIKEMRICRETVIYYRSSYNGAWESACVKGKARKTSRTHPLLSKDEFLLPDFSYEGQLPISAEKFRDLQHLKRFCSKEAAEFFSNLCH